MNSIFIATPTHSVKKYCAKDFVNNTVQNAYNPEHFYIYSNCSKNLISYYGNPGVEYKNIRLGSEFYGRKGCIHKRIVYTMNLLRAKFLEETSCPLFLSLEADVFIKHDTLRKMGTRIMQPGVDVVTANCYEGFFGQEKFSKVYRMTLGCCLIKREVLERIQFRYEEEILDAFHDAFFAADCTGRDIGIYYDPEIKVDHRHLDGAPESRGWDFLPERERK